MSVNTLPAPNVSSAQKASSSSRHYAKLKSDKATQTPMGFDAPDQLSCDNPPFFKGLRPLSDNMKVFYNSVQAAKGNIFEACTMTWLPFRKAILSEL